MIELLRPLKSKRVPGHWRFLLTLLLATALAAAVPVLPAVAGSGYTLPPATQLTAAVYGNGVYVVVGASVTSAALDAYGSVILTSTDGKSWMLQPTLDNSGFSDVTFGNGIFVAVGRMPGKPLNTGVVQTSSDGVRWRVQNFDVGLSRVVYGNGRFVLLGNNNNYVSTDGVNWTPFPNKVIVESSKLIYSNGVFADFHATQFASSQDGVNWQTQDDGLIDYSGTGEFFPNIGVTGAVYGDGMYVAVGDYYTNTPTTPPEGNPVVITSRDAVKWTMTSLNESCHLESIAFGNGAFVATGANGGILTSPDGINWTELLTGAKAAYGLVSFCNNEFVALGDGGTISTSPNGVNWTNSSSSYQAVFTVGKPSYLLNEQTYPTDTAPFIEGGRVFVPVRYLGDALGANVGWSPDNKTVGLTKNTPPAVVFGVELVIGIKTITYQGSGLPQQGDSIAMDVAPLVRNGRTYLPARYVAEAFGRTVTWDQASQMMTIE
jgi:hypothetical protein